MQGLPISVPLGRDLAFSRSKLAIASRSLREIAHFDLESADFFAKPGDLGRQRFERLAVRADLVAVTALPPVDMLCPPARLYGPA